MSKLTKEEKEFERLKASFFEDTSKDPKTGDTVRYNMKPYKALVAIYGDPYEHNSRPVKKTTPKTNPEQAKKTEKSEEPKENKKSEEPKKTKKSEEPKKTKKSEEEPKKTKKSEEPKKTEEEPKKTEEEPKKTKKSKEKPKKTKKDESEESKKNDESEEEFKILELSIDKIVKKCKSDKAFEKRCNKDFWILKFHHDHLPIMNEHTKSGDWAKEIYLSKKAKSEALKLVKVAIITGITSCNINVELSTQFVSLLPERMNKEECKVSIECHFDEDECLGHYTYDDHSWTMTIDEDATQCVFSEVLMFLTKVQYHILNDEDIEVTNDNGPLKRKDVEEAGDNAIKQLIAYKMADYNELYK